MCSNRSHNAALVLALGLLSGVAAGQALPPPNPTNINFTPSTFTVPGLVSTVSTPGTMSGTFAFPWGRVYRCGGSKTLPATRHCADGTFTAGGFSAQATGCYNQAFTQTYVSGPCQACQIYFVYYGAKLVLWQRTYTVAGFSYTTKWTSFHPGPNSGGFAHYGKLHISCITDNTCPGCGPGGAGCPPGSAGDCFVPNGTPGCENEGCCTNVCEMDPFCCDVMWEQQCADLAVVACIGEGQDVGPDVEATVALRVDLDGFFNSDVAGTPPPGHPILEPSDSFAQLNEWHLCQIQQMCAQTVDGLAAIGEAPLMELIIVDTDDTAHFFDLEADPDPFGLSPGDDFDEYAPFSGLHGQGGWKGWDDDPAFDAPVTDVQARSAPQSADISGDADLVHELCSDDTGAWSYTAWQYIPTDFASGGGQFPGQGFNLLNTYSAGGPYHWSVQIRFDPTDGMAKALHGNGLDEIQVPYVSDRWVKIQVIVDKDDDWTRVYYDDDLVTEYTWTGGVLGDGGGVLDIAVVDLFANQSTSVYYDDLRLEPISPTGGNDLHLDTDGDGLTLLEEVVLGTDPTNPDTDGDGAIDGADNCPLEANPDQRDVDGDGDGDACDDCPGDLDGNSTVGITDFLLLLGQWGTSPGGPPDYDGDGVGITDFLLLLSVWGPCP